MSATNDRARSFVTELATIHFHSVFNPYSDVCAEHDLPEAPEIRRCNLLAVLARAMDIGTRSIWIGLELGRGGGRRTGLAMTDDAHLLRHAESFGAHNVKHATMSGPNTELTAGIVWSVLDQVREPVFLWNVFPFHPHKPDVALSNRRHTRQEQVQCEPLLDGILSMLSPRTIIAIGAETRNALSRHGRKFHPVRHPAYGGKAAFIQGIIDIYPK
jgi:hypothetical protein